jgi:hypothetical protein
VKNIYQDDKIQEITSFLYKQYVSDNLLSLIQQSNTSLITKVWPLTFHKELSQIAICFDQTWENEISIGHLTGCKILKAYPENGQSRTQYIFVKNCHAKVNYRYHCTMLLWTALSKMYNI